jgi:hypothetical protein
MKGPFADPVTDGIPDGIRLSKQTRRSVIEPAEKNQDCGSDDQVF